MQIRNRHWTVLIQLEPDCRVHVQMAADGKVLLPLLRDSNAQEALVYVEQTLVDMQPGDTLEAAVRCAAAPTQTYTVAAPALALTWLSEALQQALRVTKLASQGLSRDDSTPGSEKRPTIAASTSTADHQHKQSRPPKPPRR